jgi:hypothetical protein
MASSKYSKEIRKCTIKECDNKRQVDSMFCVLHGPLQEHEEITIDPLCPVCCELTENQPKKSSLH